MIFFSICQNFSVFRRGPPSANLGAAVVCDRLYVFGGFNGKHFVNTLEYLDLTTNEWTTFIPNMMSTE